MSESGQSRLDLSSGLVDRGFQIVLGAHESEPLQQIPLVIGKIPIEIPKTEVESVGIVLDTHQFAQGLDQAVLVAGERIEPVTATKRLEHDRHEVRMQRRESREMGLDSAAMRRPIKADGLVEPALAIDQLHAPAMPLDVQKPILDRRLHLHQHQIDRQVGRRDLPQVQDRRMTMGRRIRMPIAGDHSDRPVEPDLEVVEHRFEIVGRRREHRIEIAQRVDPAARIGAPEPRDPDPLIRMDVVAESLDEFIAFHAVSLGMQRHRSGRAERINVAKSRCACHEGREPTTGGRSNPLDNSGGPLMNLNSGSCIVAFALAASFGGSVSAQGVEPFQVQESIRVNEVDIVDAVLGIPPFLATNDQAGGWLNNGTASDAGSSGVAAQWTTIREDFIGGFAFAETQEFGGSRSLSRSDLTTTFSVARTARLDAVVDFDANFSNDLGEAVGQVELVRLDVFDNIVEVLFRVEMEGEIGDEETRSWEQVRVIRPGRYRFRIDSIADVHGTSIGPDLGGMLTFGSIAMGRLPDCGEPGSGSCTEVRPVPSCSDATCCERVCDSDPFCCANAWDGSCVIAANNTCDDASPCIGDINGDGRVDGADQGRLFAAWGAQAPTHIHPADLNGDGRVDGKDLGLLMMHWGAC